MTAPYLSSISVDAVIKALGAFLQPFVPGGAIVRAQTNRVAMPPSPCVVLTELLQVDLEMPNVTNDPANAQIDIASPTRIDIQIDFYGPLSSDYCKAVKGVYRTPYATSKFPANIQPLYCSDGHQGALITAEQQYESRWTLTASLQYNPTVIVPQDYARALKVNILEDLP